MAGVAGPMVRRDRVRFLLGLAVGGIAAGLVLSMPVYLLGQLLVAVLPWSWRLALLVGLGLGLALLDLLGRTPHVWRQVPQRFVRTLPPGPLGLVWGFDLGLLVTTQKTTSLLWVALAAVALLAPSSAPLLLVLFSLVATIGITTLSLTAWARTLEGGMDWSWIRRARFATGTTMLITSLVLMLG